VGQFKPLAIVQPGYVAAGGLLMDGVKAEFLFKAWGYGGNGSHPVGLYGLRGGSTSEPTGREALSGKCCADG
jgi:hypothetical protein